MIISLVVDYDTSISDSGAGVKYFLKILTQAKTDLYLPEIFNGFTKYQ